MDRKKIIKLSKKNINSENLEKAKKILEKDYEISYGKYDNIELKKAIENQSPFFIDNHLIIGFNEDGTFINDNNEKIPIERMVKAIIVEDEAKYESSIEIANNDEITDNRDQFIIIDKNEWEEVNQFNAVLGKLKVGETFLPPHSLVFNFISPTEEQKKEKIVSMVTGANVDIYEKNNYVDNCIHEIGHVYWRTRLNNKERKEFKKIWKQITSMALYAYEWEKKDEEEMFCTIYKWYIKSLLLNSSFYNILEFEEPKGLELFKSVLNRISNEEITNDTFELSKADIISYLHPKLDKTTGKRFVKHGTFDSIKDVELPSYIINDVSKIIDGQIFVNLDKANEVPIDGNRIIYNHEKNMEKAVSKKTVYVDMDGVVADFDGYYKTIFNRDPSKDDHFTGQQFISSHPTFFAELPVLEKGRELISRLEEKGYKIVFLTTPMKCIPECKMDKYLWIKRNFGDYDIIFSSKKDEYVVDDHSILIDDMDYNLKPWTNAGGTAIQFPAKLDKILKKIDEVLSGNDIIVQDMNVNVNPSEIQKNLDTIKKEK